MVNCISNDSSSAPTDPTCFAVPSTSDGHVIINTCTAAVSVGVGVDRGGTSVVEKSQVTQNTDANQTTPMESNTNVNPNQIELLPLIQFNKENYQTVPQIQLPKQHLSLLSLTGCHREHPGLRNWITSVMVSVLLPLLQPQQVISSVILVQVHPQIQ